VRATTSTAAAIYSIFIRAFARERAKVALLRAVPEFTPASTKRLLFAQTFAYAACFYQPTG
jgi:hypothetical protein